MDVSVVVPTRNRSALLAPTLRSALRQIDVDLEVIVVDEASTDDTPALLASVADRRLRVIRHEQPEGVSTARNRGAAEARGEWVAFLDDDDLWAPGKLASQLDAARRTGRDWVYTGAVNIAGRCPGLPPGPPAGGPRTLDIVFGQPVLPPEQVVAALGRYNAIPGGGSNVAVRRLALREVGPFDTRLRNTEDWEMWIRLARRGVPAWVRRPLVAYRVHGSNSSLDVGQILRGARLIEELHGTTADWGTLHRWLAESHLRRGERRAAIGQLVRAALHNDVAGVTRDLAALARRRVARTWRRSPRVEPHGSPWIEEAACWLGDLEQEMR